MVDEVLAVVQEPTFVVVVEEGDLGSVLANRCDCFGCAHPFFHKDECGDETGAVEASLATDEDAVAFLPLLVAPIDGLA